MIETVSSARPALVRIADRPLLRWIPAGIAAVVGLLLTQVNWTRYLDAFDIGARTLLGGFHPDRATFVRLRTFSELGPYVGAVFVAVGLYVAYQRRVGHRDAIRVLLMLAAGLLELGLLKLLFPRSRPNAPWAVLRGESFPSGHTANLAFCVAAALHLIEINRRSRDAWWWSIAVSGTVLSCAVAVTRVYLDRHWATDVTASLTLGIAFWTLAAPRLPRGQAVWVGLLILTAIGVAGGLRIPLTSPTVHLLLGHR